LNILICLRRVGINTCSFQYICHCLWRKNFKKINQRCEFFRKKKFWTFFKNWRKKIPCLLRKFQYFFPFWNFLSIMQRKCNHCLSFKFVVCGATGAVIIPPWHIGNPDVSSAMRAAYMIYFCISPQYLFLTKTELWVCFFR
jgi:hypothetical protein